MSSPLRQTARLVFIARGEFHDYLRLKKAEALTCAAMGIEGLDPRCKEGVFVLLGDATAYEGMGRLNREDFELMWTDFLQIVRPDFEQNRAKTEQKCELCKMGDRFYLRWGWSM